MHRTGMGGGTLWEVDHLALAFGLLGGKLAWILHLGLSYALIPVVCGTGREWLLHLLTGTLALVAALAMVVAWRTWRRSGGGSGGGRPGREGGEGDSPEGIGQVAGPNQGALRATGFLSLTGLLLSGFFLLLIVVEGLPALIQQDPCGVGPSPDHPIIRAEPSQTPSLATLIHPDALVGPDQWWAAWNLDPWLLGALYLFSVLYGAGVRRLWKAAGRGRGIPVWRVWAYFGGITALALALISPVDAVGGALFSVHMVQHMLLMVVAPPLLVLGRPAPAWLWALPRERARSLGAGLRRLPPVRWGWTLLSHPVVVFFVHVGALWIWHLPELYQAALERPGIHHLEHATFFFSAMLFWWALGEAGARGRWPGYGAGILYVFATALQSGALGALLLFAREPWYPAHQAGAAAWGVELLVDQQVAGALMWIPAGLVYAVAAVILFLAWLRRAEAEVSRREVAGWAQAHPGR